MTNYSVPLEVSTKKRVKLYLNSSLPTYQFYDYKLCHILPDNSEIFFAWNKNSGSLIFNYCTIPGVFEFVENTIPFQYGPYSYFDSYLMNNSISLCMKKDSTIYYQLGTYSGNSITWNSPVTVLTSIPSNFQHIHICSTKDGYPWIQVICSGSILLTRNNNTTGTIWTHSSGFPYTISETNASYANGQIVHLGSTDILSVFVEHGSGRRLSYKTSNSTIVSFAGTVGAWSTSDFWDDWAGLGVDAGGTIWTASFPESNIKNYWGPMRYFDPNGGTWSVTIPTMMRYVVSPSQTHNNGLLFFFLVDGDRFPAFVKYDKINNIFYKWRPFGDAAIPPDEWHFTSSPVNPNYAIAIGAHSDEETSYVLDLYGTYIWVKERSTSLVNTIFNRALKQLYVSFRLLENRFNILYSKFSMIGRIFKSLLHRYVIFVNAPILVERYSGGVDNSDPNLSLGGTLSSYQIKSGIKNNLWDDVTGDEAALGSTEYRCIYLYNIGGPSNSISLWIEQQTSSPDDTISIGLGTAPVGQYEGSISSETLSPPGISFTQSETLNISSLNPNEFKSIWFKRDVKAGAQPYTDNMYKIKYIWC
jgi:hypothetical protein